MIDYENMTEDQKDTIFDEWYGKWLNHDCKIYSNGSCDYCLRFWELCQKIDRKCPVNFI